MEVVNDLKHEGKTVLFFSFTQKELNMLQTRFYSSSTKENIHFNQIEILLNHNDIDFIKKHPLKFVLKITSTCTLSKVI